MTSDERRATNEALFRDLNERVKEIDERLDSVAVAPSASDLAFLCECSSIECASRFPMSRTDYEAVRAHAARFVVIPAHVDSGIEHVVERRDSYVVVEKDGDAEDIARDRDPRE